jgi:pimeloyl-ACP methyl ester carboxylesterase
LKPAISPNKRQYWFRLLTFFILTLAVVLAGLPALLGALFMLGLLYVPCAESASTPADVGLAARPVTISAQAGGQFKGYFIPGSNGATIIIPPSFSGGRNSRLPYAAMLARHGFNIFIFESRRCAGMGPLSLGYDEVSEVADALNYLLTQPNVDPQKIGVYGFSSAGATAVMAAAQMPQLCAVVAEGGYGDFADETLTYGGNDPLNIYFMALFQGAARLTYRLVIGHSIDHLSPVSAIHHIAPRPILLIYGSREVSLPGARRQQAAAGHKAQLWVVNGAGHGNYLAIAPQEYETRIAAFFEESLLKQPCG